MSTTRAKQRGSVGEAETEAQDGTAANQRSDAPRHHTILAFFFILLIVGTMALTFAFTAGWLTPERLTPEKLLVSLEPKGGAALGHRRNHAKGICFEGVFRSDGTGRALSATSIFAPGEYAVVGRFSVGSADLNAKDASVRVRALAMQIEGPDDALWRMALVNLPFFPVATPEDFYELQLASKSEVPDAMQHFIAGHPAFSRFRAWASSAPWTRSYAEERYNSIDSFVFIDGSGRRRIVRWSLVPLTRPNEVALSQLAEQEADFLESDIAQRIQNAPLSWSMEVMVAEDSDAAADPSQVWPSDRLVVRVGQLIVKDVEPEADGPCRSINYDPAILPPGITLSADPFPAARSSAYRLSYDLRSSEASLYPRAGGETP